MAFTVKSWVNSTSTPLSASALQDLETRLSAYSDTQDTAMAGRYDLVLPWRAITVPQSTAAATLFLPEGSGSGLAAATTLSPLAVVYLDKADFAYGSLTTKYRVRATCLTNATAPTQTFTVGLYPITANDGGSDAITMTAGTVTSGSTVAFTTPALSTQNQGNSGDFTAPNAGYYALGVVISGTTAASSRVQIAASVQARAV